MSAKPAPTPGPAAVAVAEFLSDAARKSGVSQMEMGERAGISQSQVSKYLRGVRSMTIDEFDRLCAVLGVDPRAAFIRE